MKRIIASFAGLVLLGCLILQAAPVPQSRALDVAKRVFASQPATKAVGDVKLVWDGEDIATKSTVQPAFYVFGRDGGGFVIVAGDDNVTPVLAFSDHNEFRVEGMPDNVRWWMDNMKASIRSTRSQTMAIREKWSSFVDTKADLTPVTDEYMTSRTVEWTQGAPFNRKAPTLPGQSAQAVSGCLPLAMAEILTWFGSPTNGTGTLPDYTYSYLADDKSGPYGKTITGYTLSTTYDWLNIKGLYTSTEYTSASESLKDNVAQLVYDCGVMLEASFNSSACGGTSATDSKVVKAFGTYMGYNKAAKVVMASDYSPEDWTTLMKTQVTQHPILYCGYSPGAAGKDASHAYVLDGYATYSEDYVFHFNFGWGSYCNGYYYPLTQPVDAGYNFNTSLRALIDFYPGGAGSFPVDLVAYFDTEDARYPGVKAIPDSEPYYLLSYFIWNRGADSYTGNVKFAIKKKDGSTIVDIPSSTRTISLIEPGRVAGAIFGYVTIASVEFGDRVICLYEDGGVWKQLPSLLGESISEWPLTPASFIETEDSYSAGDYFQFELKNNDSQYLGTKWTITDKDGIVTSNIPQSQRRFKLTKTGTYKIEAAVAETVGGAVTETLVTHINVVAP